MKRAWLILLLLPLMVLVGCSKSAPPGGTALSLAPQVKVVHAQPRTLKRDISQPGVIDAYERTAMYAKVSGYVGAWYVDIGDRVKKGTTMAVLSAPDLVERYKQMQAQADLDRAMVDQAKKLVLVAESNLDAAVEMVLQSKAEVKRYQADEERWTSEVKRLTKLVDQKVVDKQVLDETVRQLKSTQAILEVSRLNIKTRDAQRLATDASMEKSKVDVTAAEAKVRVSDAEERRLAALVGYLTITAPYDGVVSARNVNEGDFVLPASGDPSDASSSLGVSPSRATPMYVFVRIDPVLFVVGVPEADSGRVTTSTTARVRVPALDDREVEEKVTRTSWALNSSSRTLMAQIDMPNPKGEYLPGMYAYGSVHLQRDNVRAVPVSAITEIGNRKYCYLVVDGKAVQTRVQVGLSDGNFIEVIAKEVKSADGKSEDWKPFDGSEAVIEGELSQLSNGISVTVQ